MPFTFFAHQVPVVPLKAVAPQRWDGLALVVGTMMPDFWYGTPRWLLNSGVDRRWFDGHHWPTLLVISVLPTLVITWALRRFAIPVYSTVLPDCGRLHLRDYQALALAKHRWWVSAYSAAVGVLAHVGWDAFTHSHGAVVAHLGILRETVFTLGSSDVRVYRVLQYLGHTLGTVAGLWMVYRIGATRVLWAWHGIAVPPGPDLLGSAGRTARRRIALMTVFGGVVSIAYGAAQLERSKLVAFFGVALGFLFTSIVVGAIGRRWVAPLGELPNGSDRLEANDL